MSVNDKRYGIAALSIALGEIIVIWGGVAFLSHLGIWKARSPLNALIAIVYFLGLLSSFILSVIGSLRDKQHGFAFAALLVTIVNFYLCAVPILA